jgi:glyoxylase-like metal-dependent hydrolase (beta-lactamase superfamily II)
MAVRVTRVVTSGTFRLDGGEWQVDNNVWLVGDDREVLVIDAAHDPSEIIAGVDERKVVAVVFTHGHNDHVNAAVEVAVETDAPIALNFADLMLWQQEYGDLRPDVDAADMSHVEVAGTRLAVLHTPGHSPGGICLYAPDLGAVFTGDTLFQGGPGATGRSHSDFPTIIASIRRSLLDLPLSTVVHPGHGADTTIGHEAPHLAEWIDRGH